MPTDLLRYISGPTPYAVWGIVLAVLLAAGLIGWYVAVYVWTLPPAALRNMRWISALHRRLLARRFIRTIATMTGQYQAGAITAAQACAGYSRTLRSFLHLATGQPAQYMHTPDMAASSVAAAAPLIDALNDARFTASARVDVERFGASVEEMIRSWT